MSTKTSKLSDTGSSGSKQKSVSIKSKDYLSQWSTKVLSPQHNVKKSSIWGTYSRVVAVAVDESEFSKRAFEFYVTEIWKSEDLVVFIHCMDQPNLPSVSLKSKMAPPVNEWQKIMEEANQASRNLENLFAALCTVRKIKHKMRFETDKSPGETICRVSNDEDASLIVCGTKASTIQALLKGRGNVTEYIIKHSKIPVLTVPPAQA